jgi:hypothetical protein
VKTPRASATRRHRRRLERIEERRVLRADSDEARTAKRDARRTSRRELLSGLARRRALAATVTAIILSVAVAVPAQMQWFLHQLTGGQWTFPEALVAIVATLLIEGLCWLGAFLYADSVNGTPVRLYRTVTFVFAALAAAINYAHGSSTDVKVGVVYALASLMGVGAWELYMHRTSHVKSGMTADEIKLWALRWRRHFKVMRECGRIRATFGTAVPLETAWQMAYVRRHGNPTIPVAVTDDVLGRIFTPTTEHLAVPDDPGEDESVSKEAELAGEAASGAAVATVDVIELPVGWDSINTVEKVLERFWPEAQTCAAADGEPPTVPERVEHAKPQPKRNSTSRATTTGKRTSMPKSLKEQGRAWFMAQVANGRPADSIKGAEVDRAIGAAAGYCKKHVKTWCTEATNPGRP